MAQTSKHFLALRTEKLGSDGVLMLSESVPELSETVLEQELF
ncbi:MAG: hypothetical protein ACOYOZ_00870 [Pirellula sp.]